jgi:hypothetical protein
MEYNKVQYPNSFPGYLGNQSLRPFYHTNLQNTLEGVSLKPLSQYEKGGLESVFSDKAKTSKAGVKALLDEIRLRETLDSHLITTIDDQICEQNTAVMQLDNLKVDYSPELAKHVDKRRTQLEANVLELEEEKRKEYLECWRDLMFLKRYLLSALKDYWDSAKKRDVLSYDLHRKNERPEGR